MPQNRDKWLADSQTFSADEASLILVNYKIDASLWPVVEEYKAFFRNKEREYRFNSLNRELKVGEYGEYEKEINARRNRRWFSEYEGEYFTLLYAL
ncbi:MAG: hypothetical protein QMB53_01680 [Eubacteriales bacterium]